MLCVQPPDDVQDNPVARQLLREAHARMYKWQATFTGYRAVLTVPSLLHDTRHPQAMGAVEVQQFLTDLAVTQQVAASTQNQA